MSEQESDTADRERPDETGRHDGASRQRDTSPRTKAVPHPRGPIPIGAPRPMCSRVTTSTAGLLARGSPPLRRLPRLPGGLPVASVALGSPPTVAGAATASSPKALTVFPFDPRGEPSVEQ